MYILSQIGLKGYKKMTSYSIFVVSIPIKLPVSVPTTTFFGAYGFLLIKNTWAESGIYVPSSLNQIKGLSLTKNYPINIQVS